MKKINSKKKNQKFSKTYFKHKNKNTQLPNQDFSLRFMAFDFCPKIKETRQRDKEEMR